MRIVTFFLLTDMYERQMNGIVKQIIFISASWYLVGINKLNCGLFNFIISSKVWRKLLRVTEKEIGELLRIQKVFNTVFTDSFTKQKNILCFKRVVMVKGNKGKGSGSKNHQVDLDKTIKGESFNESTYHETFSSTPVKIASTPIETKRNRSDVSSNSSDPQPYKKAALEISTENNTSLLEIPSMNSFSSVVQSFQIGIYHDNHPVDKLEEDHMNIIKELLSSELDNLLDNSLTAGGWVPRFKNIIEADGYLKVFCTDKETVDWILQLPITVRDLPKLRKLVPEDEPKRVRCSIKIKKRKDGFTHDAFFKRLERQNPGFPVKGMKLYSNKDIGEQPGYQLVYFGVPEESLSWIKEKKGVVHFDLGETKIHWPGFKEIVDAPVASRIGVINK